MAETVLKVEGLMVSFGGARILRGVSLRLSKGDVICIIGANGAGKTTLLRTIAGLERAAEGKMGIFNRLPQRYRPKDVLALGVALVPEEGRLFRKMTVLENLMMGAFLRKDKAGIAEDLTAVYGYFPRLAERKNQMAGSLSGGERQMLAIGRALMLRPKILMMDEPSSGLAPQFVNMLCQIIMDINQTGISVILVEQNAEMALNVARYGYVMERGRIALEGETRDLLRDEKVKAAYLGL
jgi:branched-chain amino acid transport system ATP-binding protein